MTDVETTWGIMRRAALKITENKNEKSILVLVNTIYIDDFKNDRLDWKIELKPIYNTIRLHLNII